MFLRAGGKFDSSTAFSRASPKKGPNSPTSPEQIDFSGGLPRSRDKPLRNEVSEFSSRLRSRSPRLITTTVTIALPTCIRSLPLLHLARIFSFAACAPYPRPASLTARYRVDSLAPAFDDGDDGPMQGAHAMLDRMGPNIASGPIPRDGFTTDAYEFLTRSRLHAMGFSDILGETGERPDEIGNGIDHLDKLEHMGKSAKDLAYTVRRTARWTIKQCMKPR